MAELKSVLPWKEKELHKNVSLVMDAYGKTTLICAADEAGQVIGCSDLLRIGPNGITRHQGVNPDLGFPLDDVGRIMLDES